MMNELFLYGLRYEIKLLPVGSIPKKKIVFQHGMDTEGRYYDLRNKTQIDRPIYALLKTNSIYYEEYVSSDIILLSQFLNAVLPVKNPKFIEILVRGIRDKKLVSYFYDKFFYGEEWGIRLHQLANDPNCLEKTSLDNYPARFDRYKYSIYQLLKDLKKYDAKICLSKDLLKYDRITNINSGKLDNISELTFSKIYKIVGNSQRANQGLLLKSNNEEFLTLCFIRDGKPHLTSFIIQTDNKYLRKKLYGAKIATAITKDILLIDTNRLPIISRKYLRVTESDIVTSLAQEQAVWSCMKKTLDSLPSIKEDKGDKKEIKKIDNVGGYSYCELRTTLYSKDLSEYAKDLPQDYKLIKRELNESKKRKDDLVLRYLLTKKLREGIFSDGNGKATARLRINQHGDR